MKLCRECNGPHVLGPGTAFWTPQTQALASTLRQHRGRGYFHTILFSPGGPLIIRSAAFFVPIWLAEKNDDDCCGGACVSDEKGWRPHSLFSFDIRGVR